MRYWFMGIIVFICIIFVCCSLYRVFILMDINFMIVVCGFIMWVEVYIGKVNFFESVYIWFMVFLS